MALRFVVLLAHAPATMRIVQQLVLHSTQGRLIATQPVFPRLRHCILSFDHINGYKAPLWCSKAGVLIDPRPESLAFHVLRHSKVEGL
jgi:hypothetical protein